jgi:hypothetical protein
MKKLFNIISLLALVSMFMLSCNKYEYKYTYDGPNYVQLTASNGTYFVLEGDQVTFEIQFQIIGEPAAQDITMPVEFLDSAEIDGNPVWSTILPGEKGVSIQNSLTIPAGELFGSIVVSGTYDSLQFSEVDTILVQLDNGTVNADQYNSLFLLKVQKYYPYIPEEYPGHYSGTYSGADLSTAWSTIPAYPGLDIVIGEEPNTLVVTSGFYQEQVDDWGETWTEGPYPVTLYMNTDDPTNFMVEIAETSKIGVTDDTWEYWIAPHPSPGQFNAATKELTIKFYELYQGDQLNDIGIYTVTLDDALAAKLISSGIHEVPVKTKGR